MDQNIYIDPDGRRYMIGPDGSKNYEQGAPVPRQSLSSIAPPGAEGPIIDAAKDAILGSGETTLLDQVGGGLAALKGGQMTLNSLNKGGEGIRSSATTLGSGISTLAGLGPLPGALIGNLAGYGLQDNGWKNHLALAATMPPLAVARLLGFNPVHKSTKQYQAERWGKLGETFKNAPADRKALLSTLAHKPNEDSSGWTKEVQEKALKDPIGMWGTYGMLNTFGNDYFDKMDEFQRYAATKAAIDNNLLKGNKGDIIVTDPDKLRALTGAAYKNADYRKAYDAWKKANPKPLTYGAKTSLSSIAPNAEVDAANVMANAQKQIANQSAQQTKQQSLLGLLSQNTGQPRRVADYGGFTGAKNPYL